MKNTIIAEFSKNQKHLREMIQKQEHFTEAMALVLKQHQICHLSPHANSSLNTRADQLWDRLTENCFRTIYEPTIGSIAFNLWHMTRIEDITMNILVNDGNQIIDQYYEKIHSPITDTGTAISPEGIASLSVQINLNHLKSYSIEVGNKSKEIIKNFSFEDLKRKFRPDQFERILDEKAVRNIEDAKWILDFWNRKTVAGILLMPCTRHNFSHLNQCHRIKERWMKKNK